MPMSERDIKAALTDELALALTLDAEGRGDGRDGSSVEERIAIGCVIRNRLALGHWGLTYRAVCHAPRQFSCWDAIGGEQNAETWVLDPVTGKWELKEPNTSPPGACCNQQNLFDADQGRFLRFPAFSGSHGWHWFRENYLSNSTVWSYDLSTNTWCDRRPAPAPRVAPLRCAERAPAPAVRKAAVRAPSAPSRPPRSVQATAQGGGLDR